MADSVVASGGTTGPFGARTRVWMWAVASAVGLTGWSLVESLAPASLATQEQVAAVAKNLASGLLVMAGVLWLACWRITADLLVARVAAAMLVLGVGLPEVTAVGPLLHESGPLAQFPPSTRALVVVPVLALLLPTGPAKTTRSRPLSLRAYAALIVGATTAGLAALVVARQALPPTHLADSWKVVEGLLALAWLALALWARHTDLGGTTTGGRRPTLRRGLPASFALLALCELLRLLALVHGMPAKGLIPGCQLVAAGLLLTTAASQLRSVQRRQEEDTADLTRALFGLRQHLTRLERSGRERLHDARSAVVGVIGAAELLAAPRTLDPASRLADDAVRLDPDELRHLIAAELQRLQTLLDTSSVEEPEEMDLAESLAAVLQMHRLDGLVVHTEVRSVVVRARPSVTATVLDNLLRNVRNHAPGAQVWVRVEAVGDAGRVVVEDDGPGIPEAERSRVLQPGVRGSAARSAGEGLGLSSALAAVTGHGGTLTLDDGPHGGTRVTVGLPLVAGRTACPGRIDLPVRAVRPAVIVLPDALATEALAG